MSILIPIIFILWATATLKNVLFWIYIWQIKEYRLDRMRVHFEMPTSGRLVFNKRNLGLFIFLLFSFLPFNFTTVITAILMLALYGFFSIRAVQQFQNTALKLPRFTLRGSLIVSVVATTYVLLSTIVFLYFNKLILSWFLLADILTPLFVAGSILSTHPLALWSKNRIIAKATKRREKFRNLLVIGVTGSYGKSSVKELIAAMLKDNFQVVKTPANINTDIGIARILLNNVTDKHNVFVVEMGAYRKGEIKKAAQIVKPQIGILTGINPQHISLFGSLQNIQKAKYELIEALPDKGLAVFNGDNENVLSLFRQCKKPKRLYTTADTLEKNYQTITVTSLKNTPRGLEIVIAEKEEGKGILKSSLLGLHNATNIIGAATVARELNIKYSDIKKALLKIKAPPHTLRIRKGIKDSTVIDDAYAANEDGVLAALEVLNNMQEGHGKKICIMQPLIELGDNAERVHKRIASRVAEVCDYLIVTSRDYFSTVFKEALDNGMDKEKVLCLPKSQEALRKAQEIIEKGDIVLIENRVPDVVLNGVILHSTDK